MENNDFPQPDKPHVVVICFHGNLMRHEDSQVETIVDELLDKGHQFFVMDFDGVSFIDSAGIGLIIKLASAIEKHKGTLHLCNPQQNVHNVFSMLGIESRFQIFPRLGRALQSIGHLLSVEFINFRF